MAIYNSKCNCNFERINFCIVVFAVNFHVLQIHRKCQHMVPQESFLLHFTLLLNPCSYHKFTHIQLKVLQNQFHFLLTMADQQNPSDALPDGWIAVNKVTKRGDIVESYCCPGTGQRFSTYEDMMRYVIYAKKAGLPLYMPNFHWSKRNQNAGQSSESAGDQRNPLLVANEENLDSKKGTNMEKSLDSEKGTHIEISLDSKEGADTEIIDSQKTSDAGENLKPQNNPSVNPPAPAADIVTHDDLVLLQQMPNIPPVAPAADSLINDDLFLLQQIRNVPHVASGAGTQSLENPFIAEQTPNVPPVVKSTHSDEDSPLVAVPPAMIQEFAARNPRSRSGPRASKPRRFRRWGH